LKADLDRETRTGSLAASRYVTFAWLRCVMLN
jgi:hypothetical protein